MEEVLRPRRVLFVCLGNICRSPLAEGIFVRMLDEMDRSASFAVDSAGTGDWHAGELPDLRARRMGEAIGCRMTMRARQVRAADLQEFDYVLAMDRTNLRDLQALASRTAGSRAQLLLMRDFDAEGKGMDVPDPYYGGEDGFQLVAEMLERSCAGLLAHLDVS